MGDQALAAVRRRAMSIASESELAAASPIPSRAGAAILAGSSCVLPVPPPGPMSAAHACLSAWNSNSFCVCMCPAAQLARHQRHYRTGSGESARMAEGHGR